MGINRDTSVLLDLALEDVCCWRLCGTSQRHEVMSCHIQLSHVYMQESSYTDWHDMWFDKLPARAELGECCPCKTYLKFFHEYYQVSLKTNKTTFVLQAHGAISMQMLMLWKQETSTKGNVKNVPPLKHLNEIFCSSSQDLCMHKKTLIILSEISLTYTRTRNHAYYPEVGVLIQVWWFVRKKSRWLAK